MDEIKETLGGRLARLRKAKGWTQDELAKYAHVSQSTIGGIENGSRATIPGSLIDIAHALGEDAYYLRYGIHRLVGGDKSIDQVVEYMKGMAPEGKAVVLDKAKEIFRIYPSHLNRKQGSSSA